MKRVDFQQLALRKTSEILAELLPLLRAHGLSTPGPVVEDDLWEESDPREISIWLYRGTELVDLIEFFIWKDGKPAVTLDELEATVRASVEETIEDEGLTPPPPGTLPSN